MLDKLRKGAANWLAKILLGILTLSFAIWGVADVFRNFGQGSLAKLGGSEITVADYQRALQNELDGISRQFGRRLSPEEIRLYGIDQRVVSRLLGIAAIDQHVRELHLGLSDKAVVEEIQQDPNFLGANGQFNRAALEATLRQSGLSERGYIAMRRSDDVRAHVLQTLAELIAPPPSLGDVLYKYAEERRTFEHFTIDADKAVTVAAPDDAKLLETYNTQKTRFVTPEYRKVGVLWLTLADAKQRLDISEDTIRKTYDQDRRRYDVPARRHVLQLSFPDRADADKAREQIAKGRSFKDVAAERGAKDSDIDLGLVTQAEMLDPKVAEVVFKLEKDKISDVIQGRFATLLAIVTEIQPGRQPSYDEVKAEVRDRIATDLAGREIQKVSEAVEDARGAGKRLKEAGDPLKLRYVEVAAVDAQGNMPDGKPAFDEPDGAKLADAAFAGDAGVERDAIDTADGGSAWLEVLAVAPATQKPFDEVKDDVRKAYIADARRKAVVELADKLVDRANKVKSLTALATEAGATLRVSEPLRRAGNENETALGQPAINRGFILSLGAVAATDSADGRSRTLLRLIKITPAAPPDKATTERITGELQRQMQGDAVAEYVGGLQDRYGSSINQVILNRLSGTDAGTGPEPATDF